MSIRGRWQVVETPGYDMALAGAYILFDQAGGEFAFDCLTGSIHGACHADTVEFGWQGNDEMEPAEGEGWAGLKDDGSLEREILPPQRRQHPIHHAPFNDFFNSLLNGLRKPVAGRRWAACLSMPPPCQSMRRHRQTVFGR